jgi:hypothetical protein
MRLLSPFRWFPSFKIFVWRDQTFSGYEDTDRPQRYPVAAAVEMRADRNFPEQVWTTWIHFYGLGVIRPRG